MNIDICKNCEKLKNKKYILTSFPYLLHKNEYVPAFMDTSDLISPKYLCFMKRVKSKKQKIPLKKIEVNKDCPYYVEHFFIKKEK